MAVIGFPRSLAADNDDKEAGVTEPLANSTKANVLQREAVCEKSLLAMWDRNMTDVCWLSSINFSDCTRADSGEDRGRKEGKYGEEKEGKGIRLRNGEDLEDEYFGCFLFLFKSFVVGIVEQIRKGGVERRCGTEVETGVFLVDELNKNGL